MEIKCKCASKLFQDVTIRIEVWLGMYVAVPYSVGTGVL